MFSVLFSSLISLIFVILHYCDAIIYWNHEEEKASFASCWMKTFRSTIFLMMSKREMTWLTLVKRARISSHACLISCIRSLTWLCSMILFCSMFRWTCSESIENMLYMLHATYIEHNLYADFSLRLKKLLREFSYDRFTVQDEWNLSLLRFRQFTS